MNYSGDIDCITVKACDSNGYLEWWGLCDRRMISRSDVGFLCRELWR